MSKISFFFPSKPLISGRMCCKAHIWPCHAEVFVVLKSHKPVTNVSVESFFSFNSLVTLHVLGLSNSTVSIFMMSGQRSRVLNFDFRLELISFSVSYVYL